MYETSVVGTHHIIGAMKLSTWKLLMRKLLASSPCEATPHIRRVKAATSSASVVTETKFQKLSDLHETNHRSLQIF